MEYKRRGDGVKMRGFPLMLIFEGLSMSLLRSGAEISHGAELLRKFFDCVEEF